MTSVTEVELSDEEVTIVDVKEAPKAAEVMENIEENDVEPNEASEPAPPEPSVVEQQVTDLIRQAAISAKIIPTELTVDTSTIEPSPVVTLDPDIVVRSEPRRSDEAKGILAKVKAAIGCEKLEAVRKMKTPKRKTLKQRAEGIVHPAHKGAVPIPLGEGDGPS